ncbi:MAG: hypothetical protein ACI4MF_08200 [Candidatus Faecivicinus sp.]
MKKFNAMRRKPPQSDGRIMMTVRDDADFLSPYSANSGEVISSEVADFLTGSAQKFPPRTPLTLRIYSDCIDDREKQIYREAIRNYFSLQRIANRRDMRRNAILSGAMLIVGIIGLAGMFVAEHCNARQLWIECIDIFAWVFLWEAVDLRFIERRRLRLQRQRLEAFIAMKVDYQPIGAGRSKEKPRPAVTRYS